MGEELGHRRQGTGNLRVLSVGIGQSAYRSVDDGASWTRSLRVIPGRRTPIVRGAVDLARLPGRPLEMAWDFVAVLPDGFGMAVNHEATAAHVFRTHDGGQIWHEHRLNLTEIESQWTMPVPVERFDSVVLVQPDVVVLSWEDPWLHDGTESHVIYSHDRGESWRYQGLGPTNPTVIADDSGRLLAPNDGYFLESVDGGAEWSKRELTVEWPPGYEHKKVSLLRHMVFVEPSVAFALIVHWKQEPTFAPANVGLVRTTDNGAHWLHVNVFDGPDIGDINERHMLTLEVE